MNRKALETYYDQDERVMNKYDTLCTYPKECFIYRLTGGTREEVRPLLHDGKSDPACGRICTRGHAQRISPTSERYGVSLSRVRYWYGPVYR